MTRRTLPVVCALLAATLGGCPTGTKTEVEPCKQFGQSCQFAPGKLGSCVYRTDCVSGPECLVCQSQH
jgi:hypothetical protein